MECGQVAKFKKMSRVKSISCFLDLGEKNTSDPFARIIIIFDTMQEASIRMFKARNDLALSESIISLKKDIN